MHACAPPLSRIPWCPHPPLPPYHLMTLPCPLLTPPLPCPLLTPPLPCPLPTPPLPCPLLTPPLPPHSMTFLPPFQPQPNPHFSCSSHRVLARCTVTAVPSHALARVLSGATCVCLCVCVFVLCVCVWAGRTHVGRSGALPGAILTASGGTVPSSGGGESDSPMSQLIRATLQSASLFVAEQVRL